MTKTNWEDPWISQDGELVTAAHVTKALRDDMRLVFHPLAVKSADEGVANSTAVQDDDHLFFTANADSMWALRIYPFCQAASTSVDLRISFVGPPGSVMMMRSFWLSTGGTPTAFSWRGETPTANILDLNSSSLPRCPKIWGVLKSGSTGGIFKVQWAQGTSSGSAVTMKKGACILGGYLGQQIQQEE